MAPMSKVDRERLCDILTGCPGCGTPYGVEFPIYGEGITPGYCSPHYAKYLSCLVCKPTQLTFTQGDFLKFTLHAPEKCR